METILRQHLISLVQTYAAARTLAIATIGTQAAKDGSFFERIKTRSFTVATYDSVVLWFASHWPDGTPWPDGVPLPDGYALTESRGVQPLDDDNVTPQPYRREVRA